MLLPTKTREHVLTGMSATPRVIGLLSGPLAPDSPVWELSLPGRFTLRETVAHLADWDKVFLKRAEATKGGKAGSVEDPDSSKVALERGYARMDPHDAARRFSVARYELLRFFKGLSAQDWVKTAIHPRHGTMSLEIQAVHVLGHDGYHLDAIASMMALAGLAEMNLADLGTDQQRLSGDDA